MPEGDTIFRPARTLHRALAGKCVTRFESAVGFNVPIVELLMPRDLRGTKNCVPSDRNC